MQKNQPGPTVYDPVRRTVSQLSAGLNIVSSHAIVGLVALVCADVMGRSLFSRPISGVVEIVELSIVAIVFGQLPHAIAKNKLTRSDGLVTALRAKGSPLAQKIDVLAALFGLILMLILIFGVIPVMMKNVSAGHYTGTVGIFTFPLWPFRDVVIAGAVLSALELFFKMFNSDQKENDSVAV